MRIHVLATIVLLSSPVRAETAAQEIAGSSELEIADEPPPPAPPPPPRPRGERDRLSDRFTVTPAVGVLWLQVDGVSGSGMAIQPTFTRTFDRFEIQADYLLSDWRGSTDVMQSGASQGGILHRLGASARYQAGRLRVERKMTLDVVAEVGAGLQYFVRDTAGAVERADVAVGLGFRMLTDTQDRERERRLLLGMEVMVRLIVMPRPGDHRPDIGMLFVFGLPAGR